MADFINDPMDVKIGAQKELHLIFCPKNDYAIHKKLGII